MKNIISYNVNGIRAALNKGFIEWLKSENPDIVCIQETKAQPGQFDTLEFEHLGYKHFWFSAIKKGYSGVGILTKEMPNNIIPGIGIDKYDNEGRVLRVDFGDITLLSVYVPSGTMGGIRQKFKMDFLSDFMKFLNSLKKERPNIIISGDYNICHKSIDINHPERHKKTSGFLPEERAWLDEYIESGYVDTFREFDQSSEKYSWWSYRANSRMKNLGWRIDYHIITESLKSKLEGAAILNDVFHSDHCPVKVQIDF
ncbi:exodeoxyribonuclease III [Bacteroidota bacterium]